MVYIWPTGSFSARHWNLQVLTGLVNLNLQVLTGLVNLNLQVLTGLVNLNL